MDVFKQFATDDAKENSGVWCDIGDGARLLVARAGNRAYARMLARDVEKNQRALEAKTDAAAELNTQIMVDVMARTVLLNWEGIQFKGQALPYSVDNAKMLLGVKDFRQLVNNLAGDFEAYRAAQETEQVKS